MWTVQGGKRKLHYMKHHNSCTSPDTSREVKKKKNELNRSYSTHGKDEECIHKFGTKTSKNISLWRKR